MAMLKVGRVSGPLQPYADGFREGLERQGFSPWSVLFALQTMDRLSRWLIAHQPVPNELTASQVERFVQEHRASGTTRRARPRGLSSLLAYLRGLEVMVAEPTPLAAVDPVDRLLDEFVAFLVNERGLASATIWYYRATAKRFLLRSTCAGAAEVAVGQVTAAAVRSFVIDESHWRSVGSVKNVVTALRALLRFLHVRGYLAAGLVDAVPAIASWHQASLPRPLTAHDVAGLLSSCDSRSRTGCRDYAILLVLVRLGLRIGEVAALRLDDVDWRAGEILVTGKGNRLDRLPLPIDVGQAIADYCYRGRRHGQQRSLFLHARAPYGALSSSAVGHVVRRACDHAGLPRIGAHQLRHAAATALRRAGAPLLEVGQVLRHAHAATTARYGSIAVPELACVAMPWPEGGAR